MNFKWLFTHINMFGYNQRMRFWHMISRILFQMIWYFPKQESMRSDCICEKLH